MDVCVPYPAELACLDRASWAQLPADGWAEMTKLLILGWLQAIFVKRNITFFVGCTLTTPSIESIVNLLWYFSGVHLKRYKGQYTMNDTGPGKWQYSDRLAGNQLGRLLAACEQREVAYERQWVRISLWACSVCIIYVCMYLFIH